MNAYRWRGGPKDGNYMNLGSTDYVVRVPKIDEAVWLTPPFDMMSHIVQYIECEVDHERHEIIWPEPNWRGYWTDERPMRTYHSSTISNSEYLERGWIMRQLEFDIANKMYRDDVLVWKGEWVIWNPKAPWHVRQWQYEATERPVYCDNKIHGPHTIDAKWWCPESHPDSLFERKQ